MPGTRRDSKRRDTGATPRLTGLRQRFLLLLVLFVSAVLALAVLEVGLRVAGYGEDLPLFVPYGEPAADYMVPNPAVARRYFEDPSASQRPPSDLFLASKPPGGLRLFVQGASTAAGFPYGYGGTFARMLEARLSETYPDRVVEVVNTSLAGTNSYTLIDMAREITREQPDAVLIYAGHNEYHGIFGVGSARLPGRMPGAVRAYLFLIRYRFFQLVRSIRQRISWSGESDAPTGTLMERLAGEQAVSFGSELHRSGIRQFRANLRRLLGIYRRAGIPVYIATVGSNIRDQPPFLGSPEGEEEEIRGDLEYAGQRLAEGDTAAAIDFLGEAVERLPSAADLRFALARVLDRSGQWAPARSLYEEARDRDQLPFRAPSAINEVIRTEAARAGMEVVDVLEHLNAASPDSILGKTLMLEHVHPNIEGQFLIADAFYERLMEGSMGGSSGRRIPSEVARTRVPVTAVDSLAGEFAIERLTAGFPFQPRGTVPRAPVDTMAPADTVEALALGYFRGQASWVEAQQRLRAWYAAEERISDAIQVDRALSQELPFAPEPLLHAAVLARLEGNLDLTYAFARGARERGAGARALLLLGGVLASRGEAEEARSYFRRVAQEDASDPEFALAPRAFEATAELQQAVTGGGDGPDELGELASVFFLTGQYDLAREFSDRALRVEPGHEAAMRIRSLLNRIASP